MKKTHILNGTSPIYRSNYMGFICVFKLGLGLEFVARERGGGGI
jgi:hypothetical protein